MGHFLLRLFLMFLHLVALLEAQALLLLEEEILDHAR